MINPPKATKAPDIERKSILDWSVGTVTDYDARRIVDGALKSSANMVLEQNGVIRPRPSLVEYGPQPNGEILGELFECKVVSGTTSTFYLISMQVVDGKANIYYCKGEDVLWTKIPTKDYDTTTPAHYVQIGDKVLIMNGSDHLSYIDLVTWELVQFMKVEDPSTTPTATATGLSGSGFKVYYAVSANSTVGETAASEPVSVTVGTSRDEWNPETQYVDVKWDAIAGATSYNIYVGTAEDGGGTPTMYLIQSGIESTKLSFRDDGTFVKDLVRTAPQHNSTEGPRTTRGTVVNGRVWMVGDVDNPYYVWYGGDYGYEIEFAPGGDHGGGYTTVANGSKEVPISVMPFRRGQGDSTVVVLTQGSNGSGRRFQISSSTITYGGEPQVVWSPTEDSGRDGTDSPDAVVVYNNSLFYPSRDGFKTTGTMPQLQNVLSTRTISASIKDQISLLKSSAMNKAVGLAYEGQIYWALPVGATDNNRVWVYYPDQKGAWMTSWYLKVKWMTLYNDNGGNTHFLMYCEDGKIYELSRTAATIDDGTAFMTEMTSGMVQFSKDGRDWARLIQIVFTFLKPKGEISVEVEAMTEDGRAKYAQTILPSEGTAARGWSQVVNRSPRLAGWSNIVGEIKDNTQEYIDEIVEIDEDVQWFAYTIRTTKPGVDYKISSVVAEYVSIGIKDLS